MGVTADGYPWIEDPDQPADMLAWTATAAAAAQTVMDAHEADPNPHVAVAAMAQGTWAAGAIGENTINLSTLVYNWGGFTLSAGALVVPTAGVYALHYFATVDGEQQQVWIGPTAADSLNINTAGLVRTFGGGPPPIVRSLAAGATCPKVVVYAAASAGHSGTARLTAIRIGN